MKLGIASDHQGYKRKQQMLEFLRNKNYDIIDLGTDSDKNVDYTEYCLKLCDKIISKEIDYGILICGTGIGMSICANKVDGIYCAKACNKKEAMLSRKHNDANVIAFSKNICFFKAKNMVLSFLHTPFLEEERYIRRINTIKKIENKSNKNKRKE